jgi:hypothetical protein
LSDNTCIQKLFFIKPSNRCHFSNLLVHERLSETWLIQLVVAHLSIANQIDHHIVMVKLSVLSSSLENEIYVFHTVSIDVEDRSIDSLRQI